MGAQSLELGFSGSGELMKHERPHRREIMQKVWRELLSVRWLEETQENHQLMRFHERTHMGEKAFKCTKCDNSFSSSNEWKNYKRTPTVDKLWVHKVCHELLRRKWTNWENRTGEKHFFVLKVYYDVLRVRWLEETWENPQLSWEDTHRREAIQVHQMWP